MSFDVHIDGQDHHTRPFTAPHTVEFPLTAGAHPSYLFPFSDQVLYPTSSFVGSLHRYAANCASSLAETERRLQASSATLPPAAVVFTVSVCSAQKR